VKREIVECFCDVCKEKSDVHTVNYPVLFHTSQDDGAHCKVYVSQEKIDLCRVCLDKALVIHGWGAQGANHYQIWKEEPT